MWITVSAPPPIPRNEPQLNLRWPPSVRYTRPENSPGQVQDDLQAPVGKPPVSSPSPIYGQQVSKDEIRLALLSAGEGDSPVNLSLETRVLADCLEYETVSHMWGGEDGNYTPCWPVFIGPYWDALLQTKNCWEILKTMRHGDRTRLIWVDALCVMIYEQCFRVLSTWELISFSRS